MKPADIIQAGSFVIVQRQKYTKLVKLKANGTIIKLGKDEIQLDNIVNHKYYSTFKMILKPKCKRLYSLESTVLTTTNHVNIEHSGTDNRNITDDSSSQSLTKDQIEELRDQATSSSNIVEKLIQNSKTFNSKTEYSQEKYMKKKERKYFEYIQVRKPSIRLLTDMFFRLDPSKTLGLRIDDLSQILTYANVQANGSYLLYDSGTSGLMTAAIAERIGSATDGRLVHAHPGNECQKSALMAMQFPNELLTRCVHVNLYSVLRCFYQTKENDNEIEENSDNCEATKSNENDTVTKKRKFENYSLNNEPPAKKVSWQIDNERACTILKQKVDGVIVVAKEHPNSIVEQLIAFLKGGGTLVVFSLVKEILEELYFNLKNRHDFINVKLSNNFMRNYQVLPDRTHPEVTMNFGGYVLSGYKIKS